MRVCSLFLCDLGELTLYDSHLFCIVLSGHKSGMVKIMSDIGFQNPML